MPETACDDGFQVIYGPNESGKTLLLEAILKLLDPDIATVMPGVERVPESPEGYVAVETDTGEWVLGEEQTLGDISPIETLHLRNIFVVRENDLGLEQPARFYDTMTEQIANLHTSEIDRIQTRFENLGRLTSSLRRISAAAEYDDAATVLENTRTLIVEIQDYVGEARADDLDELEGELIRTKARIRRIEADLEIQEAAKRAADYERLADRLSTVEAVTEDLEALPAVSQDTLEQLTGLRQEIESDEGRIRELERQIDDHEEEVETFRTKLEDLEEELDPLEAREDAVDDVYDQLTTFRTIKDRAMGADRSMRFARIISVVGIGFGGLAVLVDVIRGTQLLPALLFLGAGLVGAIAYYFQNMKQKAVEQEGESVLRAARDSGLDVQELADIAPAIEAFREELETTRDRKQRIERQLDINEELLEEKRDELDELEVAVEQTREEKDALLEEAGVSDIYEYRQTVERREELERRRASAALRLVDEFGESAVDTIEAKLDFWRDELQDRPRDTDRDEVDASDYDEGERNELQTELAELEETRERLRADYESHQQTIAGYGERAGDIDTRPFIGEQITLRAKTTEGLVRLTNDLEKVPTRIDRDADISREALEILDEMYDDEQDKVATLFEPDGRATQVFRDLTDGRYGEVEYDPDQNTLKVHRSTGKIHTPDELSQGTRDQLYLAARISLAEQLLEAESGFFLMDDPFLSADRTRLHRGIEVLQELAEQGWQILYLTTKQEVGVDAVDEFGLERMTLDPLP